LCERKIPHPHTHTSTHTLLQTHKHTYTHTHTHKEDALQAKLELMKDGVHLETTKKKIASIDQAIADTQFTLRALEEFDLPEGTSITDKMRFLQEEITRTSTV